jgi:hypothetical protein
MTRPPGDRSDDGLTAELREQLEEGAGEARRLAAVLELDRLSAELLAVVDQTVQPAKASLWLRPQPQVTSRDQGKAS